MNYLKRIGRLVAICICAVCVGIIPITAHAMEAVSYTHLDVYKRQLQYRDYLQRKHSVKRRYEV